MPTGAASTSRTTRAARARPSRSGFPRSSVELAARRRLFETDAPRDDVGPEVSLAADPRARHAAQHRDLARVRERVRDRPREYLRRGVRERPARLKPRVEALERGEEPRDLLVPRKTDGVVPDGFSVRHRERPVEEVAHVREDLDGRAHARARAEVREALRRLAHGLARAVRERRERVAEHRNVGIGGAHARTFRTILPNPFPDAIRSYALRTSPSGKTVSTTGSSLPASTAASIAVNSASVPIVDPRIESCFQKMTLMFSGGAGPDVAPHVTMRPFFAAAVNECRHVVAPTESTTTSTPRFPVISRTALPTSVAV